MSDETQATPFEELERQMMSHSVPKNEREWWAWREISDLRAQLTASEREREELSAKLAVMAGALEFYADGRNYHWTGAAMTPFVNGKRDPNKSKEDLGAIARTAIANLPDKAKRLLAIKEALRGLVDAVGNMRVPQNVVDAGLQINVTLGPAYEAAVAALAEPATPEGK